MKKKKVCLFERVMNNGLYRFKNLFFVSEIFEFFCDANWQVDDVIISGLA